MIGFILIVEANLEFNSSVNITNRIKNTFPSVDLLCITTNSNDYCRVFFGCVNDSDDENILCSIRDCVKKHVSNVNVDVFQTTTKYAVFCNKTIGDDIYAITKKIEKSSELIIDN